MAPRLAGVLCVGLVSLACAAQPGAPPDPYRERLAAIDRHDFFQSIEVVDRVGKHLATVAPQGKRTWIPLSEIPDSLRMAVVATEDETFYSNNGVDASAVARAAIQNAQAGETVSGASTITMQLVRIVAFPADERYEQTMERKLREAQLASELAARLSKDDILAAYLNVAFFGHQAYGVEAAANTYFGKSARQLTLGEATLLAGLPQAPSYLDPFENPEGALARRLVVLQRMVDVGVLSRAEAEGAAAEPLVLADDTPEPRVAGHFVDYVMKRLPDIVGSEMAARGGFTVTTTLDLDFDRELADIARRHVDELRDAHDLSDASLVALRPGTGEILALVGGLNYDDAGAGQVDVATSPRQPGSAIKPVVYAAALEQGWTPASLLWDIPYEFKGASAADTYRPSNYDGRYRGPVRLRQALANSLNAATIGLAADVGLPAIHDQAASLGIDLGDDPYQYGLSVALGGAEVRLLDLTGAYAALAAGGRWVPPNPVLAVESFRGGELLVVPAAEPVQAVSPATAWLLSDILSDDAARRDAFGANNPLETSRHAAVKTGTTTDFRDNLTVGYTSYLALGVWTGNKDGHPMRDVLGITGAAPIWHDAMEAVFADPALMTLLGDGQPPPDGFARPSTVVEAEVCALASLELSGACAPQREYFPDAAVSGDLAFAYGWFGVRSAGGTCSEARAPGDGQIMLTGPRDAELNRQVRAWAAGRGVAVAPPDCSGTAPRVAFVPQDQPRP